MFLIENIQDSFQSVKINIISSYRVSSGISREETSDLRSLSENLEVSLSSVLPETISTSSTSSTCLIDYQGSSMLFGSLSKSLDKVVTHAVSSTLLGWLDNNSTNIESSAVRLQSLFNFFNNLMLLALVSWVSNLWLVQGWKNNSYIVLLGNAVSMSRPVET